VDLYAMFPGYPNANGKVVGKLRTSDAAKKNVADGRPSLLEAMEAAQINTPERVAAFLTTLCFESWCEYNALQPAGDPPRLYTGRGFIQLTGLGNYEAAGQDLGVDLVNDPEDARSLQWSAKIATWYWTKARPRCNEFADNLQMGKVNAAIGYPRLPDGSNDNDRCMVFGQALKYLTGSVPAGINCTR